MSQQPLSSEELLADLMYLRKKGEGMTPRRRGWWTKCCTARQKITTSSKAAVGFNHSVAARTRRRAADDHLGLNSSTTGLTSLFPAPPMPHGHWRTTTQPIKGDYEHRFFLPEPLRRGKSYDLTFTLVPNSQR